MKNTSLATEDEVYDLRSRAVVLNSVLKMPDTGVEDSGVQYCSSLVKSVLASVWREENSQRVRDPENQEALRRASL